MQLTSWNNTKLVPCHQSTLSTTSCPLGFSYDGAKSNINSDINNLIMIHTGGSNEWFIVFFIMSHFLCVSDSCLLDKSRTLWEGGSQRSWPGAILTGPTEAGKVNMCGEQHMVWAQKTLIKTPSPILWEAQVPGKGLRGFSFALSLMWTT